MREQKISSNQIKIYFWARIQSMNYSASQFFSPNDVNRRIDAEHSRIRERPSLTHCLSDTNHQGEYLMREMRWYINLTFASLAAICACSAKQRSCIIITNSIRISDNRFPNWLARSPIHQRILLLLTVCTLSKHERSRSTSHSCVSLSGLTPVLMTPFDPMTNDYRMDRVRVIVCPRRNVVMQVPVVG